jgi:hypothetical protein
MRKLLAATFLSAALLVPAVANAQDRDDHHQQKRVYDKQHKGYHDWNESEDKAWHQYLDNNHHAYVDYDKANSRQQKAYWNWRHEHPDSDHR